MPYLMLIVLILATTYLPQLWVQSVIARYHRKAEPNFPGTGGEFARHILDQYHLQQVKVEITNQGDHYDPTSCTVRLTHDKFTGRSLTAITVAAHECGHALQHAAGERLFMIRTRLAYSALLAQRLGSLLLFSAPLIMLLFKVPSVALINILGAVLVLGFALVLHVLTLPVEIDASFKKALPILESGYLTEGQKPAARKILRVAAWTYVAASLANLLNFWRWIRFLR